MAEPVGGNPEVTKVAVVQSFTTEEWNDGIEIGQIIHQRLAEAVNASLAQHFRLQEMTPAERAVWQEEADRNWERRHALEREAQLTAAEREARRCPTCGCDPDDHGDY